MQITDLAYIDDTGYHFADYQDFLTWRQEQLQAIYGADIYLESDSQDGQLIALQALADYQTAALGASVYNSFSPRTAQGVGLSRNVKINGLERRAATKSTVTVTIVGQAGTIILNGIVQDTIGQKWNLPESVTIPGGGSVDVVATAQEAGALSAAPSTVTKIFTPTLGWQTVTNAAAATEGVPYETDAELRIRQARSTANPSLTVMEGTVGAVANILGVTKIRGYENDTGSTDGNGIPGHSICIVVNGGTNEDIAKTIALHKTPGTGTYGDESVSTTDANGMPLIIKFQRPDDTPIQAQITITINDGWSSDYEDQIKAAVALAINAVEIGGTILITKLFIPAYLVGTPANGTFDIQTLEISKVGDPLGTSNIVLGFKEQASCDVGDISVVIA